MAETLVAKKPKPGLTPVPPNDTEVTTWKCYQRVASMLRLIGSHLNLKQEAVLDLFADDIENYLITLQSQDLAERKRRKGE